MYARFAGDNLNFPYELIPVLTFYLLDIFSS